MAISATDVWYRAEYEPAEIMAMRGPLCATFGQPNTAFGCRGNLVHASGYHRSFAWVVGSPDSRYGWNDYSVRQSLDIENLDRNACCAFDFVPGPWGTPTNRQRMIQLTSRVRNAALARDPRLAALREFAGTLDGRTVVTFNCADGSLKSPFDQSHLDHVHASFWRSRARRDHTGIVDILLGDDDDMDAPQAKQLADLHYTATHINVPGHGELALHSALGVLFGRVDALAKLVAAPDTVTLSPEQLDALAAKLAGSLSPGTSAAGIRAIIDEELDEQSRAGADTDPL